MHRRLLETELSVSPPTASGNRTHDSFVNEANFDTNMVIILAALLCALICALGLNSIVRCALRCSHRLAMETPEQAATRLAATGLKKRDLRRIPVAVYGEGVDIPATECPICLGEFVDGEKVRVLPKCNHGFHVRCIDTWLLSHSSCPNCRHSLLNNNERSTASSSAAEEPAGGPAPGNDAAEQTTVVVNMRRAEQQRQQSWRISVHAEFKNFNFGLNATKISPTWKFHRFSIFLKLHNFLLQLRSDSETPPFLTRQRTTIKSRLLAAFHKLRHRRSKNHPVTEVNSPIDRLKHFASKEPVSKGGSLAVGILAFLFQSSFEDHHRGIIVLSSFLLICFAVLLGKSIPEKSRTVLTLSAVAIVIATAVRSGLDYRFMNYDYHHQDWISELVRKAWNKIDLLQHLQ